jgi:hypothetical protein
MEYPLHLLPKNNYKTIDFDSIDRKHRFLIRRTDGEPIANHGFLKDEVIALFSDHLRDYSTNLLGEFQLEDLQWRLLRGTDCLLPWSPGMSAVIPNSGQAVLHEESGSHFFLDISKIHQFEFRPDDEFDSEEVICKVLHTPIRSNFWHCSLRWFCNDEDSEHWKKSRLNRLKSHIRSFIRNKAELEEPIYQAIDPVHYTI